MLNELRKLWNNYCRKIKMLISYHEMKRSKTWMIVKGQEYFKVLIKNKKLKKIHKLNVQLIIFWFFFESIKNHKI